MVRSGQNHSLRVDIVSTEAEIYSGSARLIVVPGMVGEMGILPGHTPLLTRLKPGSIRIYPLQSEEVLIYVSGGLLEVQPAAVTVLADTGLRAELIDELAAREAVNRTTMASRRAEKAMAEGLPVYDYAKAKSELAKALAQLRTLEELRKRSHRQ
jgi:F-type H+-transporting ATPase subunit epsilon